MVQQRSVKEKYESIYLSEPRRSSRSRNQVVSYQDEVFMELPHRQKRRKLDSNWSSYLARPLDEVKTPSFREVARAFKNAEKIQSNLTSGNPSFIKTMVRSHVYSCFWLGLPSRFCEDHLPKTTVDIVLEAEDGSEYDAVYIGTRSGVSGGWRAFALDYKLDAGDALLFELTDHWRFKVYVVRASTCSNEDDDKSARKSSNGESNSTEDEVKEHSQQASKVKKKNKNEVEEVSEQALKTTKKKKKDELISKNEASARRPLRASTRLQKK